MMIRRLWIKHLSKIIFSTVLAKNLRKRRTPRKMVNYYQLVKLKLWIRMEILKVTLKAWISLLKHRLFSQNVKWLLIVRTMWWCSKINHNRILITPINCSKIRTTFQVLKTLSNLSNTNLTKSNIPNHQFHHSPPSTPMSKTSKTSSMLKKRSGVKELTPNGGPINNFEPKENDFTLSRRRFVSIRREWRNVVFLIKNKSS